MWANSWRMVIALVVLKITSWSLLVIAQQPSEDPLAPAPAKSASPAAYDPFAAPPQDDPFAAPTKVTPKLSDDPFSPEYVPPRQQPDPFAEQSSKMQSTTETKSRPTSEASKPVPRVATNKRVTLTFTDKLPVTSKAWQELNHTDRLKLTLQRQATIQLRDANLYDLSDYLQKELDFPVILLNQFTGDEAPIWEDILEQRVDWQIKQSMQFQDLLEIVLLKMHGAWYWSDSNVFCLCTPQQHNAKHLRRTYVVQDLITDERSVNPYGKADDEALVKVITDTVAASTWKVNGGQADLVIYKPNGMLIVSNMQSVHLEIEKLLAKLRQQPRADRFADKNYGNPNPDELVSVVYRLQMPTVKEIKQRNEFQQNNNRSRTVNGTGMHLIPTPPKFTFQRIRIDPVTGANAEPFVFAPLDTKQTNQLADFITKHVLDAEYPHQDESQLVALRESQLHAVLPATQQRKVGRWLKDFDFADETTPPRNNGRNRINISW